MFVMMEKYPRYSLDRDSRRILAAASIRSMTIRQLSSRLGIPVSICGKKVFKLRVMGLLTRNVYWDGYRFVAYFGDQIPKKPQGPNPLQLCDFLDT
jgi:hypothetical protein